MKFVGEQYGHQASVVYLLMVQDLNIIKVTLHNEPIKNALILFRLKFADKRMFLSLYREILL